MAVLAALALACSGGQAREGHADLAPFALARDPAVLADLAARDELSPEAAERHARQVATLAARYLARSGISAARPDELIVPEGQSLPGISPAREAHLLRSARARVWLSDVFEPSHRPEDMPAAAYERADALTMPSHGTIHVVCNFIVGPASEKEPSKPAEGEDNAPAGPLLAKDDPDWRARAERKAEALMARMRTIIPDPSTEPDCELFSYLLQLGIDTSPEPDLTIRVESGGFDSCVSEAWDPGWVEALCPVTTPSWVGPFWTKYGVHVVPVFKVVEADRYEASEREARVREKNLVPWRSAALGEELGTMRRQVGVRVLTPSKDGEDTDAGAAAPPADTP